MTAAPTPPASVDPPTLPASVDPPTPPASVPPPTTPTAAPRRWDWKPKLRWFAAEIAVVVAGVLIALALNAWWAARQDAAKEQHYLRQLHADLGESEAALGRAVAENEQTLARLDRLDAAFEATPPPDPASVDRWSRVNVQGAVLTMGSARALIETGDLNLIRDDSLRAAIVGLIDALEQFTASQNFAQYDMGYPAFRSLASLKRPAAGDGHPFHVPGSTLLTDPVFYDQVQLLRMTQQHILGTQRRMRQRIQAALTRVEAELNR